MNVTPTMISENEATLESAQVEVDRLKTAIVKTKRKRAEVVAQIDQLKEELTELAAQFVLGRVEASAVDEHIAKIEKLKQQATVFKFALTGLEPINQAAIDARNQAARTLSDNRNWKRFWDLKAQLLEQYDRELLHEAKQKALGIGFHSPAMDEYSKMVDELKKIHPPNCNIQW